MAKPFDKAGQKVSVGDFVIYTVFGAHVQNRKRMRFGKVTKLFPDGRVSIKGAVKNYQRKLEVLPTRAFDRVGERVLKLTPGSVPANYKKILADV